MRPDRCLGTLDVQEDVFAASNNDRHPSTCRVERQQTQQLVVLVLFVRVVGVDVSDENRLHRSGDHPHAELRRHLAQNEIVGVVTLVRGKIIDVMHALLMFVDNE